MIKLTEIKHSWIKFKKIKLLVCKKCGWYKRDDGKYILPRVAGGWVNLGYEPVCEDKKYYA